MRFDMELPRRGVGRSLRASVVQHTNSFWVGGTLTPAAAALCRYH